MWVEEVGGAMSIGQFRSHLVDRAWFLHQNYLAWWLQNGALIPCLGNTNPVEEPTADSVFCCYCYVLVQKASWDAHCRSCSLILQPRDKTQPQTKSPHALANVGIYRFHITLFCLC